MMGRPLDEPARYRGGPPPDRIPDLLVVGGGPAGLATAIRARQAGLQVTLVDARRPPIDKACGEGLMPDGAALLRRLGVVLPSDHCRPFRGIRYLSEGVVAEGALPGPPGLGVRRLDLHLALVRRAEATGADLRWGVRVTGLEGDGVSTDGGRLRARWIVAADGLHSPLRRAAGLEGPPPRVRRFGLRRHFAVAPWTDCVEVHWSDGVEAYVTPVGDRLVGVALLYTAPACLANSRGPLDLRRPPGLGRPVEPRRLLARHPFPDSRGASDPFRPADPAPAFDRLLRRFPALVERLADVLPASPPRGAGPLERRTRGVVRGSLALVGDAAGYVDAITGEGLSLALHDAFAVVDAIARGELWRYAAAHRRIVRLPTMLARLLLFIERRPRLRRRLMRALAADPRLFRALLAAHVRVRPPASVAAWVVPRLAWRLALPAASGPAQPPPAG
jgi:flavin-dependent dehydrogenase